jgi:ribosomal-protein-alanine N-acetyltransferase
MRRHDLAMPAIEIRGDRFALRDLCEADRDRFLAYQLDPRYLRLYDFAAADRDRARSLFDLFLEWQHERRRRNIQLGVFDSDGLCGCAGLRKTGDREAILGIELAPSHWGRFRLALDVAATLVEFGFEDLGLRRIVGDTASGNRRVAKLARRFGAEIVASRDGPEWMRRRGWHEVDWALRRGDWRGKG